MNKTDALIIGAGPTGLFTAHQLKLIGLDCEVVDNLDKIGGQCIELYPDKPIYDIPAVPECTGDELTNNLIKIFKEDQIKYNKEHYKNSYILSYGVFGKKVLKNLKKDDFRSKKVLIGPLIPKENLYELFKEVNKFS